MFIKNCVVCGVEDRVMPGRYCEAVWPEPRGLCGVSLKGRRSDCRLCSESCKRRNKYAADPAKFCARSKVSKAKAKAADPEKILKRNREWTRKDRAANPERYREYSRAERAADPEGYRARQRKWRADNADRLLPIRRAKYAEAPEPHHERSSRYRAANPDLVHEKLRRWQQENPGASNHAKHKRQTQAALSDLNRIFLQLEQNT